MIAPVGTTLRGVLSISIHGHYPYVLILPRDYCRSVIDPRGISSCPRNFCAVSPLPSICANIGACHVVTPPLPSWQSSVVVLFFAAPVASRCIPLRNSTDMLKSSSANPCARPPTPRRSSRDHDGKQ